MENFFFLTMLMSGYKIKEVPVKMRVREQGESMHKGTLTAIRYMINMFYTIIFIVIQNLFNKKVKTYE